ncbi:SCO family protein [Uliginosibacterium sp. H3]|uniref:SCO family protein n=1 Tax=Uliginosibacterium silvisoli TaxID=3114758 RepID=A0ABU6K6C2_9RHOO|nr:SCO family protein [Uliginosibacterium sp. H3]
MRTLLLISTLLLACASASAHDHAAMLAMQNEAKAPAPLPGESLHRLVFPLTDQRGKTFHLADEHRPATLITMFYGDCQIACPIVIENVKRTVDALPVAQRSQVRALLVSLNPGIDTPASLDRLAKRHELSPENFRLAVANNDAQTRLLAAALGIRYRRTANGEVNHSTRFLLVDARGVTIASSEQLNVEPDAKLLAALKQTLR